MSTPIGVGRHLRPLHLTNHSFSKNSPRHYPVCLPEPPQVPPPSAPGTSRSAPNASHIYEAHLGEIRAATPPFAGGTSGMSNTHLPHLQRVPPGYATCISPTLCVCLPVPVRLPPPSRASASRYQTVCLPPPWVSASLYRTVSLPEANHRPPLSKTYASPVYVLQIHPYANRTRWRCLPSAISRKS